MTPLQLQRILQRLLNENLHGPMSSKLIEVSEQDLDSKDPRWIELFIEYFINSTHDSNDDLLFFVRLIPLGNDSIFVKRKIPHAGLPPLEDLVDWKQTFFLNLISQISCTMTVAVCEKSSDTTLPRHLASPSELLLNQQSNIPKTLPSSHSLDNLKNNLESTKGIDMIHNKIPEPLVVGSAPTPAAEYAHHMPQKSNSDLLHSSNESLHASSKLFQPIAHEKRRLSEKNAPIKPNLNSDKHPSTKNKMIAKKRIIKKVYSAPYKSRMDVKDAFMNECSFPLVYYTVLLLYF